MSILLSPSILHTHDHRNVWACVGHYLDHCVFNKTVIINRLLYMYVYSSFIDWVDTHNVSLALSVYRYGIRFSLVYKGKTVSDFIPVLLLNLQTSLVVQKSIIQVGRVPKYAPFYEFCLFQYFTSFVLFCHDRILEIFKTVQWFSHRISIHIYKCITHLDVIYALYY